MSVARTQITEIVAEFREERERRKMSQDDVAGIVGVTRGQIGHWERAYNNQQPSIEQMEMWASCFGWSIRLRLEHEAGELGAVAVPTVDFAQVVGRLGIVWRELPESARHGISEVVRGFSAMIEKK